MSANFWTQHCPVRDADLTHKHERHCDDHFADQCCECGMRSSEQELIPAEGYIHPATTYSTTVEPPIDVQQRLRSLGLIDDEGVPTERKTLPQQLTEDMLTPPLPLEPRYAEGEPVGPPWGRGRSWRGDGNLNPRDIPKLLYVAFVERTRGYR